MDWNAHLSLNIKNLKIKLTTFFCSIISWHLFTEGSLSHDFDCVFKTYCQGSLSSWMPLIIVATQKKINPVGEKKQQKTSTKL